MSIKKKLEICIFKITNEFITRKDSKKKQFLLLQVL